MAEVSREEMGKLGQEIAKKIIKKSKNMDRFGQIDWLVRNRDATWYSVEVKYQEYYTAPPFDGHGLPIWQVETRMKLYEEKEIRPMLLVCDANTSLIYWQWLDALERGESHDTGISHRRIYPLDEFNVLGKFDSDGHITIGLEVQ